MLENLVEFAVGNLPDHFAVADQSVAGGDVNQLGRPQPHGHLAGEVVGVDAVGVPLAVEAKRRDDRDAALRQQTLQVAKVDPLRLAGELVIGAVDDAARVRRHGVGRDAAQAVGGEALEDLVRQPVGRRKRQVQRGGVHRLGAVEVGRLDAALQRHRRDLASSAVHQRHADIQRAQDGEIEQEVREILVADNRAIDADDKNPVPKLRNILENSPEISRLHVAPLALGQAASACDR